MFSEVALDISLQETQDQGPLPLQYQEEDKLIIEGGVIAKMSRWQTLGIQMRADQDTLQVLDLDSTLN